jgi:hypothetical protein
MQVLSAVKTNNNTSKPIILHKLFHAFILNNRVPNGVKKGNYIFYLIIFLILLYRNSEILVVK